MMKLKNNLLILLSVVSLVLSGCSTGSADLLREISSVKVYAETDKSVAVNIKDVPQYSGTPYVEINNNEPSFSEKDTERVEEYSKLDKLGRCGPAFANVGKEIMPTSPRESIRDMRPSGWHTVKYDDIIEDRYLYNRCHLPFENQVADYVQSTGNHVLYRVRPIFKGDDLVARGVQMEAKSVEDGGKGVSFNVYCYNVQPGIRINYKDGSSRPESKVQKNKNNKSNKTKKTKKTKKKQANKPKTKQKAEADNGPQVSVHYIANTNTKKFHISTCRAVKMMKAKNMYESDDRDELISRGFVPCKICWP